MCLKKCIGLFILTSANVDRFSISKSLADRFRKKSLCNYFRVFHLTLTILLYQLAKSKKSKITTDLQLIGSPSKFISFTCTERCICCRYASSICNLHLLKHESALEKGSASFYQANNCVAQFILLREVGFSRACYP